MISTPRSSSFAARTRLDPRYQALYNIGETYYQLQDYAHALETLTSYLAKGGAQVSDGRREEVQKEIEKLGTRVATIEVTTRASRASRSPSTTSPQGHAAYGPLTVSAGRRKLTATRAGKPPITQVIEVAGGDAKKITLEIPDDVEGEEAEERARGAVDRDGRAHSRAPSSPACWRWARRTGSRTSSPTCPATPARSRARTARRWRWGSPPTCSPGAAIVTAGVSIYFTVAAQSPKKVEKSAVSLRLLDGHEPPPAAVRSPLGPRSLLLTGSFLTIDRGSACTPIAALPTHPSTAAPALIAAAIVISRDVLVLAHHRGAQRAVPGQH